ncbi:MAG: ankyrin repeat domain-containing protein, partial [Acidobacteriota bacterium]
MRCRNTCGWVLLFGLAVSAAGAPSSALADAAERRDRNGIRELLQSSGSVNVAQADGTTALHWAVYHDDVETTALLIKAGANVNAVNLYGLSPL